MGKIKVVAREQKLPNSDKFGYCLRTDATYNTIKGDEVISEVSAKMNMPENQLRTALKGLSKIVASHVCNGHSVEIPNFGFIRFGLETKAVDELKDVTTQLIVRKKLIVSPAKEIKNLLKSTSISITAYDRTGNKVATGEVSGNEVEDGDENEESLDPGNVNAGENGGGSGQQQGGNGQQGSENSGNQGNNGGTNVGPTPSETPTDPTKILLLFNDGAHGNVIVKRMEVEPGHQLTSADLPEGYIYAFKSDDQADIDAASAGEAVWVTLSPKHV